MHGELPPTEVPPLQCRPINNVTFECREKLSEPPRVHVHLLAAPTLSLSGNVPFHFSTTFVSHAAKPITVLAERSRIIIANSDIEIVDAKTVKRVAPDLIDDGDMEGPWTRDDFLTLEPGIPYVEERVLESKDGLGDMQPETDYILRFPNNFRRWWIYDSVDVGKFYSDEASF